MPLKITDQFMDEFRAKLSSAAAIVNKNLGTNYVYLAPMNELAEELNSSGFRQMNGATWSRGSIGKYLRPKPPADTYKIRAKRAATARAQGRHSHHEWLCLKLVYQNKCLACGGDSKLEKDHVIPVWHEGLSSDLIDNIQPLCRSCNTKKGTNLIDYRASSETTMTPENIKAIRARLKENTSDFGKRFLRSGRTIEEWEQGRRRPDPLALVRLQAIETPRLREKTKKSQKKSGAALDIGTSLT